MQNHSQPETTLSISTNTQKISARINVLFLKFAAFYGQVWKSLFKHGDFLTFTKIEWDKGLNRFDNQVLIEAIERCRDGRDHKDFPPTLPQFIDLCRSIARKDQYLPKDEEQENFKQASPEFVAECLAKIKASLGFSAVSYEKLKK